MLLVYSIIIYFYWPPTEPLAGTHRTLVFCGILVKTTDLGTAVSVCSLYPKLRIAVVFVKYAELLRSAGSIQWPLAPQSDMLTTCRLRRAIVIVVLAASGDLNSCAIWEPQNVCVMQWGGRSTCTVSCLPFSTYSRLSVAPCSTLPSYRPAGGTYCIISALPLWTYDLTLLNLRIG